MLDHIVASIAVFIAGVLAWLGYPGIVLMMALESSLIPIPSEIVMPFAGYLAATGRFHLIWTALAGALGCNIGSTVIYYVGAQGGRRFVETYGAYFFLTRQKIDRVEAYFRRWGGVTLLVTRMMPLLPVVVSLPAGFARMPMWKFQLYTFIGCFIWCLGLAALGYEFGLAWKDQPWIKIATHWLDVALVAAIVLGLGWLAWRLFFAKKRD
jgi:membrane protein DedA with SNARE-associated domain